MTMTRAYLISPEHVPSACFHRLETGVSPRTIVIQAVRREVSCVSDATSGLETFKTTLIGCDGRPSTLNAIRLNDYQPAMCRNV
jgi:hypothetical protein